MTPLCKVQMALPRMLRRREDGPDGRLVIRHKGLDLPYRTFDKVRHVNQAAIVENKRLGPMLALAAQMQQEREIARSKKAPRRRGQADRHMFKEG